MVTRQELESISKEIKSVSQAKRAINRQIAHLSDVKNQGGIIVELHNNRGNDYVSQVVVSHEELEEVLNELNATEQAILMRAQAVREELKRRFSYDTILCLAIDYHYLRGMPWNSVANIVGISTSTCQRMCKKALKELDDKQSNVQEKYSIDLTRMAERDLQWNQYLPGGDIL